MCCIGELIDKGRRRKDPESKEVFLGDGRRGNGSCIPKCRDK